MAIELDVYAPPFVPNELTSINDLPAQVITTESAKTLDYGSYVQCFAGSAFLPSRSLLGKAVPWWYVGLDYGRKSETTTSLTDPQKRSYLRQLRNAICEEIEAESELLRSHNLYQVYGSIHPGSALLKIIVPGLREYTPVIQLDDIVSLRHLKLFTVDYRPFVSFTGLQYDTRVAAIDRKLEILYLQLPQTTLAIANDTPFNVVFHRSSLKGEALREVTALVQLQLEESERNDQDGSKGWLHSMLFPMPSDGRMQTTLAAGLYHRDHVDDYLNFEQVKAIDAICKADYGEVPYLISGPPGTGKTKTLVETVHQLLRTTTVRHLLVCAPSDQAADTLALRLSAQLMRSQMLRLIAPTRTFAEVPDKLLPYCHVEADTFTLPPFSKLTSYQVVVTSCRDAYMLVKARLTNQDLYAVQYGLITSLQPHLCSEICLHWDALLIDEAAQATEPEALIPIVVVAPPPQFASQIKSSPRLVLAGDQKQLGPRTASKGDMAISLFDRLIALPFYADHPLARNKFNPAAAAPSLRREMLPIPRPAFSNLIRNYRSHQAILAVPSALFYHDTLLPEALQRDTESMLPWQGWAVSGRKWPVLFMVNRGNDDIERDGGGWYNTSEVNIATFVASSLISSALIKPEDVCVMAPFGAQVRRLRQTMRIRYGSEGTRVNIGPMEAFQGLESKAVVLCTTRSRNRFLDQDAKRGLGIINEPRRFNVALTRAKDGLIVIGNPNLLKLDPCWNAFMAFCWRNGLWRDGAADISNGATDGVLSVPKEKTDPAKKMKSWADVVRPEAKADSKATTANSPKVKADRNTTTTNSTEAEKTPEAPKAPIVEDYKSSATPISILERALLRKEILEDEAVDDADVAAALADGDEMWIEGRMAEMAILDMEGEEEGGEAAYAEDENGDGDDEGENEDGEPEEQPWMMRS